MAVARLFRLLAGEPRPTARTSACGPARPMSGQQQRKAGGAAEAGPDSGLRGAFEGRFASGHPARESRAFFGAREAKWRSAARQSGSLWPGAPHPSLVRGGSRKPN